jgi:hypothetical protein
MFDEYHQHFKQIGFTQADWDYLTRTIQGIYNDIAFTRQWEDHLFISRWLDNKKKIDAVKEIQKEKEKEII